MNGSKGKVENILGVDVRVRSKLNKDSMSNSTNVIFHNQINGDQVFIPLNISEMWPRYR